MYFINVIFVSKETTTENWTLSELLEKSLAWCPTSIYIGPLIFNIFLNDVFYVLDKQCNLCNYADDNTLVNSDACILTIIEI